LFPFQNIEINNLNRP